MCLGCVGWLGLLIVLLILIFCFYIFGCLFKLVLVWYLVVAVVVAVCDLFVSLLRAVVGGLGWICAWRLVWFTNCLVLIGDRVCIVALFGWEFVLGGFMVVWVV